MSNDSPLSGPSAQPPVFDPAAGQPAAPPAAAAASGAEPAAASGAEPAAAPGAESAAPAEELAAPGNEAPAAPPGLANAPSVAPPAAGLPAGLAPVWDVPKGADESAHQDGAAAATTSPTGADHAPTPARQRLWPKLVAVAVVAGLVAATATAGLLGAFRPRVTTGSLQGLGQTTPASPVAATVSTTDWQKVIAAVAGSVVAISVDIAQGREAGSGVIVKADGTIVTNAHVVADGTDPTVTLADGRIFASTLVGTDTTTDLAVLKLKDAPADLVVASLGDSTAVAVGQSVLAIGNPLGLAGTATTGIVSAVNRPVTTGTSAANVVVTNAIQIDAAINPGNSGGPLFNTNGQVVGITSSIATLSNNQMQQAGSIGLGFAIPANVAANISGQLLASGTATHGFLGVNPADVTVTADGQTRKAAKVVSLVPGGPAAASQLKVGDAIVAVDGVLTPGAQSLSGLVRTLAPGAQVTLTVVRDDKVLNITITLGTRPNA